MNGYSTIDSLPDLPSKEMATAGRLTFTEYPENDAGWDNNITVNGSESFALLHSVYRFEAIEGATYDVFSTSDNDPFLLRVYDQFGNTIEANTEEDDPEDFPLDGVLYGTDVIWDWVAPYSGVFYIDASWNQSESHKYYDLSIYEDIDTAFNSDGSLESKVDKIFDWAEDNYSILFPNHSESQEVFGYYARLFSNGNGLGEKDGDIYFYDGGIDGTESIVLVGAVSDLLPLAIVDGL